jgi:hypothetical protein
MVRKVDSAPCIFGWEKISKTIKKVFLFILSGFSPKSAFVSKNVKKGVVR